MTLYILQSHIWEVWEPNLLLVFSSLLIILAIAFLDLDLKVCVTEPYLGHVEAQLGGGLLLLAHHVGNCFPLCVLQRPI